MGAGKRAVKGAEWRFFARDILPRLCAAKAYLCGLTGGVEHAMPDRIGQLRSLQLPAELHLAVNLVLDRPDLQATLGAEREVDGFVRAFRAITAAHGLPLDEATLRTVLRPDPLGLGRFAAAPVSIEAWPGKHWLPARSVPTGAAPAFDWLWFGDARMAAPFHEDEVRRASALPLNWLLRTRTTLDAVIAGQAQEPSLPLKGLIFHLSRCGSTLLAQMLGAIPGTAVSSEPEPLDAVLRWIAAAQLPADQANAAITAMVAALGRCRTSPEQHRQLIKLEVWHSLFLPELRRALPQVPWLFLRRDPVEVLVSQLAQPSIHVVPGALDESRLGLSGFDAASQADYAAQVLGRCAGAVAEHWPLGGGQVLDYAMLRHGGANAAAAHFGIPVTEEDAATMAAAAQRDAKTPFQDFTNDSARKQAEATPEVRAATAQWIDPPLAALDQMLPSQPR